MEEKKNKNHFIRILTTLFIIFFCLYLMDSLGYYNYATKNKVLTDEQIQKFELDIQKGNKIDVNKYIETNKDYSNLYSNIGLTLSNSVDYCLNKGLKKINKVIKKLFK